MKAYFYCSYNLSPTGYQEILLDTETGLQSRTPVHAEAVRTLLTHGGARSAIGRCGDEYYLVLKDMRRTKPEVPANTPGRDWYMNCALLASSRELAALCAVAYDGYTAHQAFVARLADCLSPKEEEVSYAVDPAGWRELAEAASARYQAFVETGEPDFADAPCGLGPGRLRKVLEILRSREIGGLYEFVMLEGELDYFLSANHCKNAFQVRHFIKVGPTGSDGPQDEAVSDAGRQRNLPAPGLLIGAGVVGLGVAGLVRKHAKKNRRKRNGRR